MAKNIILIILLLVIAYFVYQSFFINTPVNIKKIKIKNKEYSLEIAKTIPQKSKGLMNRSSLCSNCGMIFISSLELPQIFWMKNTLIPLDIIFIDKQGKVINIAKAYPQPNTPDNKLKLYQSLTPAKYVIELNLGETDKLSLKTGDTVDLTSIK